MSSYNERKETLARLQATDADYMAVKTQVDNITLMESAAIDREELKKFTSNKERLQKQKGAYTRLRESLTLRTFNKFMGQCFIESLNVEDLMKVTMQVPFQTAVTERLNGLMGGEPELTKLRKLVSGSKLLSETLTDIEFDVVQLIEKASAEKPVEDLEFADEELPEITGNTVDEISDVVKNKVIEVIKSEQEEGEKNKADMEEIIASSKPVTEGTQNLFVKSPIQRKIKENYTLFRGIAISVGKEAIKENTFGFVTEGQVKMDMVITEAIVRYTLLEFFSTICLESYTPAQLDEMTMRLAKG